ncbi:glycosyltransferase family 2 protein [Candidatus Woesearchaeota archaeon]|nr:glycosyltransferase family 2 protein [Candidatus Woesearchaeota archaeon]
MESQQHKEMQEEKQNPKVLIAAVTFAKHAFCFDEFMNAIRAQNYKNYDLLFVDNSRGDLAQEYQNKLKSTGAAVIHDSAIFDHKIKTITNGRKMIRDYLLQHREYEYLFFVDTDVIIPPFALSRLLKRNKSLISGVVLTNMKIEGVNIIAPCIYDFGGEETVRVIDISEVLSDRFLKIYTAGFGCALIARKVLEKVDIDYNKKSLAGEDVMFFVKAKDQGFDTFADTAVKCSHLLYPFGDKRNEKYRFEPYLKREINYSFNVKLG